jgi:hypothetical protein
VELFHQKWGLQQVQVFKTYNAFLVRHCNGNLKIKANSLYQNLAENLKW